MALFRNIASGIMLLIAAPLLVFSQSKKTVLLTSTIQKIIDSSGANVGFAFSALNFNDTLSLNNNVHYPMQSVFKFPLAVAILHDVDKGKLSLQQVVHVPKETLDKDTWSPMMKDFPGEDIDITVADLLKYAVSKSDNNACDVLFRLAGGTKAVRQYIHSVGVKEINIAATEREMKKAWPVQYTNWCQPTTMLKLLQLFYNKKLLSETSNNFLMKLMTESETGTNRLKGLLPKGTIVAHKTGTSDTNDDGLTAATNDVGVVTLPDGRHYAIVVFVSDYKGGTEKGELVIARISKAVWDHCAAKQ